MRARSSGGGFCVCVCVREISQRPRKPSSASTAVSTPPASSDKGQADITHNVTVKNIGLVNSEITCAFSFPTVTLAVKPYLSGFRRSF